MFEKELNKFRVSVLKTFNDFFGKEMSVSKAIDWCKDFDKKYLIIYGDDYDLLSFKEIKQEHQEDFARYKTIKYLLNVLIKLNELEKVIKGENDDNSGI